MSERKNLKKRPQQQTQNPNAGRPMPQMPATQIPDIGGRRMPQMPGMSEEQQAEETMRQKLAGEMSGPSMQDMSAVRTGDEEAAYTLGQRMGAANLSPAGGTNLTTLGKTYVDEERLTEAERLLMDYKKGKASVDRRIIDAQDWWKMRNWRMIQAERGTRGATEAKSNTAWLWNCIVNKHADAMDSYPEPVVLPRMEEDKAQAKILSEILPVILQINGFEKTYSDCQWQKMIEGTACYHVGWDKTKLGGLGDVSIRHVNMLNLFWEPGINDIQESQNVFYCQVVDNKQLEERYPQLKGKLKNAYLKPNEYRKDDNVTTDEKSVLVDWYYHKWDGNRKVLHFCQFVNHEILYSTENNGEMDGLYEDGEYPFVLDPLFPVQGSPAGYGYIDIGKDAQADIDILNQAMVVNAVVTSTPRYFIQSDGSVNEDEFADWSKPFVHTNGSLGDNALRPIETSGIQTNAMNMLERKIDELKFVTNNQDVNNGGTPTGVTAASAIAALQEQSGRASKDSNRSGYRAASQIYMMSIERIRQFMSIERQFRITGANGQEQFIRYSNEKLREQEMLGGLGMEPGLRKPVFDIDVRSQRETSYTKMAQNELAIQLLQLGVFNPGMTDQSLMMLDMMEFKGKEELMQKVQSLGTMQDTMLKVGQIALALAEKYDPAVAQQLAMIMQGISADMGLMPQAEGTPGSLNLPEETYGPAREETTRMQKVRAKSNNTSRVD